MRKGTALLLLLLAAVPARAADNGAAAAADAFYAVSVPMAKSGGGIPGATARVHLAPLLTPRLNRLIADAAVAETRFNAKNKDSPPLIEGDLFSSLFEGPTSYKVGACTGNDSQQRCAVSLTRQDPGQKPANWMDIVVLENDGGWKVDDIAYDANFAFGNTGTLGQMLKMVLTEAP